MYKNNLFLKKYNGKEKVKVINFFNKLEQILDFSKKDKKKVYHDFEEIFLFYNNKSVKEIVRLLDIDRLKNSYQKSNKWYALDTSSKIYPLSMGEEWMSIYRLSLYLDEKINPVVLQIALFFTVSLFPIFKTSINLGFFWNYLDNVNKHYNVEEENDLPCASMNLSKNKNSLFRVIYYKNRISCEFFHVLADAYGGSVFLNALVNEYLRLLGKGSNSYHKTDKEELIDMFQKIKVKKTSGSLVEKKALSIDGRNAIIRPCQIIHFDLNYLKLHCIAKEKNVTINELFLAFIFIVLSYSTSKNGDIKIQVPVNMRKYYPSKTLRNFSLYNTISLKKSDIKDFENVLRMVKKQSREKLSKEKMDGVLYQAKSLVKNVSLIPLIIKRPITKFIYQYFGDKGSTTVLSNLGKIDVNEHVLKGDFVLGTTLSNKVLFSVITVNNTTTLTISKFTTNASIENNLYSLLKEYDLIDKVHGSKI